MGPQSLICSAQHRHHRHHRHLLCLHWRRRCRIITANALFFFLSFFFFSHSTFLSKPAFASLLWKRASSNCNSDAQNCLNSRSIPFSSVIWPKVKITALIIFYPDSRLRNWSALQQTLSIYSRQGWRRNNCSVRSTDLSLRAVQPATLSPTQSFFLIRNSRI